MQWEVPEIRIENKMNTGREDVRKIDIVKYP